ncbi:MAG TPA: CsbD family protein [Terriglobales bacterium]|nr:CsbD family protein [Terriglobales bacterium]
MNTDRAEGKWKQMKGAVKEKWGKLTDDDLTVIEGNKDQLVGKVQERYGIAKDEAQRQVDEWNRLNEQQERDDLDRDLNRKAS